MPHDKGGMLLLAQVPGIEQRRLLLPHQEGGTRAYLEDLAMQPAEVSVRERSRILHAPDAKDQDLSHHCLDLMNLRETGGKEEWTSKESRCPTSERTNKSRRPWLTSRLTSTYIMPRKEKKGEVKGRKARWSVTTAMLKGTGLRIVP